jgi:hypothetical protein
MKDMIRTRRAKGTFLTTQTDFFDMFLKKIDECRGTETNRDIFTGNAEVTAVHSP